MTTTDDRRPDFRADPVGPLGERGWAPPPDGSGQLPAQRDDDEFAPTIVRGRE